MGAKGFKPRQLNEVQQKLVEDNVRLVSVAYGKLHPDFFVKNEKEELMSVGYIGLCYAANKFDASFGYAFSTYAVNTIYRHMLKYISKQREAYNNVQGDDPANGKAENHATKFDLIEDETQDSEKWSEEIDLNHFMNELNQKEQTLLYEYYYLGISQREIGLKLGIAPNTVSRRLAKAKAKLQKYLR